MLRRPRARCLGRGRVVGAARGHAPTGPGLPGLLRPADERGRAVRINLAKVVPFLCLVGIFLLWAAAQNTGTDESPDDGYDYGYDTPDTGRADAYFDAVAIQLADPGVYVDPAVTEISADDAARLDAIAADTAGPVRVLVVPADALRESDPSDPDAAYGNDISYADDELPGQLYDRVGVDGTYAVLVDADSSFDGRSFTAYQFSEERPFYEVEDAVDQAVDCCAPDYTSMLDRFLEHADEEQTNPWPIVGWVVAGIAAWSALLIGGSRWQPPPAAQDRGRPGRGRAAPLAPGGGRRAVPDGGGAAAGAGRRRCRRRAQQPHPSGAGPGRGGPAPARRDVATARAGWTPPTRSRTSYAGSRTRATSWPPSTRSATGGRCPRRRRRASSTPGTGRASTSGRSRRSSAWSVRCPCARGAPRRSTPAGSPRCGPSA